MATDNKENPEVEYDEYDDLRIYLSFNDDLHFPIDDRNYLSCIPKHSTTTSNSNHGNLLSIPERKLKCTLSDTFMLDPRMLNTWATSTWKASSASVVGAPGGHKRRQRVTSLMAILSAKFKAADYSTEFFDVIEKAHSQVSWKSLVALV